MKEVKTFDSVYEEIRDREEFIAAKLLGKKQHAVYLDKTLFDTVLKMSKEQNRSFNGQIVHLVRRGLVS